MALARGRRSIESGLGLHTKGPRHKQSGFVKMRSMRRERVHKKEAGPTSKSLAFTSRRKRKEKNFEMKNLKAKKMAFASRESKKKDLTRKNLNAQRVGFATKNSLLKKK